MTVSNRRPPTCKDGALPTELIAHKTDFNQYRELGYRHLYFTTHGLVATFLQVDCRDAQLKRLSLAHSVNFYFIDESEPSLVIARGKHTIANLPYVRATHLTSPLSLSVLPRRLTQSLGCGTVP